MYIRESVVRTSTGTHRYVQIVESVREGKKVRQRTLLSLGNKEKLDPAAVDRLIHCLSRYGTVVAAPRPEAPRASRETFDAGVGVRQDRTFGSIYVLDRLWKELGLRDLFRRFAKKRRFKHDLERATFAMVANRLVEPSSKLSAETWLDREAYFPLPSALTADQLYSTLGWLHQVREEIEVAIHRRLKRRHLTGGTVYFYDTTLSHFEGRGPHGLAQVAGRKGARTGKQHVLVGLVTSSDGWPVMHHVYPGASHDTTTFRHTLGELYERFGLREIVVICDRGMHSQEIVELLEDEFEFRYIVATRLRKVSEVNDEVLSRAGRYRRVEQGLEVKEVWVEDRRYVVCRSDEAAQRDRHRREEILAQLAAAVGEAGLDPASKKGMKLQTTSGKSRYLRLEQGRLVIDHAAADRDARYDGKWVLRTNLRELDPGKIALRYKAEARIEHDIRFVKSFVELRPTHHRLPETVDGHVFVCVLALLMRRYLQHKLGTWPAGEPSPRAALEELARVRAQEIRLGPEEDPNECFWTRSDLSDEQERLLKRLGVGALPRNLAAPPSLASTDRARTTSRRRRRRKPPRGAASPDLDAPQ